MEKKNDKMKSSKRKSWMKVSSWSSLLSVLIGILGSILSTSSLVGLRKLTSQQILIFASIFAAIVAIAAFFQRIQKMGEKTRKLSREIEEAYISQLDMSLINPEQK
jgi:uncharacterized membrane protein